MEICVSIRRFMLQDIMSCLRDQAKDTSKKLGGLQPCDVLSLQLWLPFLRESYRIIGYRDVAPQYKLWSMQHCMKVAKNVERMLALVQKHPSNLASIGMLNKVTDAMDICKTTSNRSVDLRQQESLQATSHWIISHAPMFPVIEVLSKAVRKIHATDSVHAAAPGFYAPIWEVLNEHGQPLPLDFGDGDPTLSHQGSRDQSYHLYVDDLSSGADFYTGDMPAPRIKIGSVKTSKKEGIQVVLKSRLFSLNRCRLARRLAQYKMNNASALVTQRAALQQKGSGSKTRGLDGTAERTIMTPDFSLQKWSGSQLSEAALSGPRSSGGPDPAANPALAKFYLVEATAYNLQGHVAMKLQLDLGLPCYCYPPGTALSVDLSGEAQGQVNSPSVMVVRLNDSGTYAVRNMLRPEQETEFEFDPTPSNHCCPGAVHYSVGSSIIVRHRSDDQDWSDATVKQLATPDSVYQYGIEIKSSENPTISKYLDTMNSARAMPSMSAAVFEEEIHKIKAFFRARHSFVIDALSGTRLNVKECAPPTLSMKGEVAGGDGTMSGGVDALRQNSQGRPSLKKAGTLSIPAASSSSSGSSEGSASSRYGWPSILAALDSYEKATSTCDCLAFLVLGSPGSGKSCLVNRVIMEILDRYQNLVPLMIPISDVVKRSSVEDLSIASLHMLQDWFDQYLRMTFGDDSNRYWMICQAMAMNRIVFLFEGLEDAGALAKVVEMNIKRLILDRHMVIVTSRPLLGGESSLEEMGEYIISSKLENLSDEHKRAVARKRLGPEGIDAFDLIFRKLQESQAPLETQREAGDLEDNKDKESEQDVFGNPMMLSMLLCYLQTMEKKKEEQKKAAEEGEEVKKEAEATLTAVYRVAMDVMLQRVQSKQQADRHNKDQKVEQCKLILEKMGMRMQLNRQPGLSADEVHKELPPDLHNSWIALNAAFQAGHAMFMRLTQKEGKTELKFLVKGFQNFWAACAIARGDDTELPELCDLLTDPWWAQMLEMLAEAWPDKYVELIQHRLKNFKPKAGESFLHIAARAGHRPIFNNLHRLHQDNKKALFTRNEDNWTPLHVAAEKGNTNLCELMLDNNAAVDAEDSNERLALHVAMQHGAFQTAKFLLQRYTDKQGSGQQHQFRPKKRADQSERLAGRIFNGLSEEDFRQEIDASFVELRYFSEKEKDARQHTLGSLLAVYWITANSYDLFVRGQKEEVRLTKASWEKLQDWTRRTVGLMKSSSTVGAMFVFTAIASLGKIKPFRQAFAPEFDEPTEALASILQKSPLVIPSFSNLTDDMQNTILSALKADFNFGQFLQAENLPASLFTVKQMVEDGGTSGSSILGFFLFKIFATMCGLLGKVSLEGSLFMVNNAFTNFKVGLDVLGHLTDEDAFKVYNRFLQERAKGQGLTFNVNNPKSRATVRLACLARFFDADGGKQVQQAFAQLDEATRKKLIHYINADGINVKPGILMYNSPNFIFNSVKNPNIGLARALQVLLTVYEVASQEYSGVGTEKAVVTIFLDELAEHAKNTSVDAECFGFTKFEITRTAGYKAESQGSVHISPWQLVTDPKVIQTLTEEGENLTHDVVRSGVREPGFLKRLPTVFPELHFLTSDEENKHLVKETYAALLSVYWTASDQMEAFTRGQQAAHKLSEKSWGSISKMIEDGGVNEEPMMNAILVIMVTHALGKLPKFREQLAPDAEGHRQTLEKVLDTCPKVLPSYCRLPDMYRSLARECLTQDFNFEQFLSAESLPASITSVKEMVAKKRSAQELEGSRYLKAWLYCVFAEISASMGSQSLDGSIYMNEARWSEFKVGVDALQHVHREPEQDTFNRILEQRALRLGLEFSKDKPQNLAMVRLATLSKVTTKDAGQRVKEAFESLDAEERNSLTKFLTADGIKQKPGFILSDSTTFLENALSNSEVGLVSALRILLQVYTAGAKEFAGTTKSIVTVRLERLAAFAQEFAGSVTFQDLPFELVKEKEAEALVIPKMWIPVRNKGVLDALAVQGKELAKEVITKGISERQFKVRIMKVFPELSYFNVRAEVQRNQTTCSMLTVLWLIGGQYEAFIRTQPEDEVLSKQSWAWIQEWIQDGVRLNIEGAVDAALTFMAIHALGKIREFREELAPQFDAERHDVALAHILTTQPEVVPSFKRLPGKYQTLIIDSLSVDFQFSQFLQAENVPANLVQVKEKLAPHGDDGFAFFCFRIFVQMCGKLGAKSLQGSQFMTEPQFQRFRPGLDALQQLRTLEAGTAYNAFLLLQGSKALSRFASPEHQALARLLCLGAASDYAGGDAVCEAFDELPPKDRALLTRWLTADGITHRPGYVLCSARDLFRNAQANPAVGLANALRMMVRVQERCDSQNSSAMRLSIHKVYVHLNELASWAQDAGPVAGDFNKARFDVLYEDLGDTRVFAVEVMRPTANMLMPKGAGSRDNSCCGCFRCLLGILLLLASLAGMGAAACIRYMPERAEPYLESYDVGPLRSVSPRTTILAVGGGSALVFLMVILCLCCRCLDSGCCAHCQECGVCGTCCRCGSGGPLLANSPRAGTLACGYSRLESDLI